MKKLRFADDVDLIYCAINGSVLRLVHIRIKHLLIQIMNFPGTCISNITRSFRLGDLSLMHGECCIARTYSGPGGLIYFGASASFRGLKPHPSPMLVTSLSGVISTDSFGW